jgi:uracil-DNA glycosylase family 4
MGFGGELGLIPADTGATTTSNKSIVSDRLLHQLECRACPLNHAHGLRHPKMPASGAREPEVYIIGEAPGRVEDAEGVQFVGESGDLMRPYIPAKFLKYIRWNNILNCRPPDNRDPERIERECCRPRVERDIALSQPVAIFGMGAQPLSWAGRSGGIYLWRGRRFPIRVGDHVCWYYPMLHPAGIIHQRRNGGWGAGDDEFALELDLRRAFADIEAGLPEPVVHTAEFARSDITCLTGSKHDDLDYLLQFLKYAGAQPVTGVDYETQNLRPYNKDSEILTAAVSVEDETVSFAYRHPAAGWSDRQLKVIDDAWMEFLQSRAKKAVHQLSFEMEWTCYYFGEEYARSVPWEDTMTQAYVIDERVGDIKPGALSLEWLTQQHFGINIKKLSPKMDKARMRDEGLETLLPYNGIDAKYHRMVYGAQKRIIKAAGLVEVYAEKVRQVPTVVLTQLKGIPLDAAVNTELRREYARKLAKAEAAVQAIPEAQEFKRLAREEFNPGSPQHVIIMLRDILKTRVGQPGPGWTTKEAVLKEVKHPIAGAILNYRKVQKIKGTYVDPYSPGSPNVYPGDIIHTNLGTCFTETGRLNSEDPNIQNVPVRTPEGRKARKQIAARVMASFDYGQIDARIIACGSRDRHYCKALWEDYDIHKEWAERLAHAVPRLVGGKSGIKDPEKMGAFRNHIKSVWVFALFYGAALYTTAKRLECEERELTKLYDAFWSQFAGVRKWQDEIGRQFRKLGYVQLFGGLRRHAPLGHGQQINTPVQGATNRIVMLGMNRLSETGNPLLQANMQIHDDLTFCFNRERDFEDSMPQILDIMLDAQEFPWFAVPLVAEVKRGTNWAEMTKVGTYSSVERLGWPTRSSEFA